MGDYLKIAANRALGRAAPAIQPRIPSLFEPPAAALSARLTRIASTPPKSEQQPWSAAERLVEPAGERISELPTSLPVSQRASREVLPPTDTGKNAPLENLERRAPITAAAHPEKRLIQPSVPAVEPREEITVSVAAAPAARLVAKPRTSEETGLQAAARLEPQQPTIPVAQVRPEIKQETPARTVDQHVERSLVKEVIERVRRVQETETPVRQPYAAASPARSAPGPHETTFSVSEPLEDTRPVINVVIGRVSVNAVTERPAAAARATQPPGPTLSLDRYLEQRRGHS